SAIEFKQKAQSKDWAFFCYVFLELRIYEAEVHKKADAFTSASGAQLLKCANFCNLFLQFFHGTFIFINTFAFVFYNLFRCFLYKRSVDEFCFSALNIL